MQPRFIAYFFDIEHPCVLLQLTTDQVLVCIGSQAHVRLIGVEGQVSEAG